MKEKFIEYLLNIGAPQQVRERVLTLCKEVEEFFQISYEDIFVETKKKEESVVYTSLWLFSSNNVTECKNFMTSDDYDWIDLTKSVTYISVSKQKWSAWQNPTIEASLRASIGIGQNIYNCDFSAQGLNCTYLTEILHKYYFPNRTNLIK